MRIPEKKPETAVFLYNGYLTNFETTDKQFAAALFSHLGRSVKKIKEEIIDCESEAYTYEDEDTFFATLDPATALVAYEYSAKKHDAFLEKKINELKRLVRA